MKQKTNINGRHNKGGKMQCIDCPKFRILNRENKETYSFCTKKQEEKLPFDRCSLNHKEQVEQRAVKIYYDNYKTSTLDEIVKMINVKSIDKSKLNYLITKYLLPRKAWE